MGRLACVIAGNAANSVSPLIWNYWFNKFGIDDALYDYYTATRLEVAVPNLKRLAGLMLVSVSTPHKEGILSYVDCFSSRVARIGAASVVFVKSGIWCANNYDGYGFIKGLSVKRPAFDFSSAKVLVLGTGGTAKSVILSLIEWGVRTIYVVSRSYENADSVRKDFSLAGAYTYDDIKALLPKVDLVFNGTTLSSEALGIGDCDLVYDPNYYLGLGANIKDGLLMLLYQSAKSFKECFGTDVGSLQDVFEFVEPKLKVFVEKSHQLVES